MRFFFRTLQKFLNNPNNSTTLTTSRQFPAIFYRNHFLSPLISADVTGGPLFLSSSPWQFSQSATPTIVQCDVALSRKIEEFRDAFRLPVRLGFCKYDRKDSSEEAVNSGSIDSMKRKNDKNDGGFVKSFVNWPNFVSVSRMVSGPVLGWMIVNEMYLPAFVGLGISGASDWLDGYLARRMGINSVVGSYLDPLADKVLIGCVAIAMVEANLLHPGLVGLIVLRDVMLVGGAVYKRGSSLSWKWDSWHDFFNLDGTRPEMVQPLFISKVNTVFQLILVAAALLQPEFGNSETQAYITYLSWLVASTTVASTACYGVQHMRNRSVSISRSG